MSSQKPFEIDDRHDSPNEDGHRFGRFKDGWNHGVSVGSYTEDTLKKLTWENLGNRLGYLFGLTDPQLVEMMYYWCVMQQKSASTQPR